MTTSPSAPLDRRTLALIELLSTLWQERRAIQDMAERPDVSDADLRSFCRLTSLPPTQDDLAWAMKMMEDGQ